jgi:tRNA-specific 2-thiouridylase
MTTLINRTPDASGRAGAPLSAPAASAPPALDADRVDALMAEYGLVGDFLQLGGDPARPT